ncbi:2'-5' RNA ligase family protein [Fulvivirga sp.]|uniref:2'-5' RNA ligase family protein n=1 Tax=Fulvivirga sp. TaxID=1931237 RepID=UPI0032EEA0CB
MRQLSLPFAPVDPRQFTVRITPPTTVFDQVRELKELFYNVFGDYPLGIKSQPHITLVGFLRNGDSEWKIVNSLHEVKLNSPIEIEVEGFDMFYPNILILKVRASLVLNYLNKKIYTALVQKAGFNNKSFGVVENFHITISKTRDMKQLYESLHYFRQMDYPKSFYVNHISLLSREPNRTWDRSIDFCLE